jgi:predicted nucleic acid-binding Zn ribbon protein
MSINNQYEYRGDIGTMSTCVVCEKEMVLTNNTKKYCCKECKSVANKERRK